MSREEAKHDRTVMVLSTGTRRCVVHKQIPKGDEVFDVQWGVEGHTEPAPPPNLHKLPDID